MPDLEVDVAALLALASRAERIAERLAHAPTVPPETAEMTGHRVLADRVREFATCCDLTRARIAERLGALGRSLTTIAGELERVDGRIAGQARR
ncbi:MAG TPA: hypothetical protein VNR37_10820 [Microbacteriaceae bacterium]|nr:hypothetical protein [Microbacteriaceae bacterium]